jgi:isocitrate/methylisocitrate lyase
MSHDSFITEASRAWTQAERWKGIARPYSAQDVAKLRGSLQIEYTLARRGAERLWQLLHTEPYVQSVAAVTGNQAVQMVQAGLKAINVSGGCVAAEANDAGEMYPDEGLYPVSSVPNVVRKINNAFRRTDQISHAEGRDDVDWFVPIKADGEAGFGGVLNTFELTKAMIEAGAAAVSFEDQLASGKKCGHLGGKVVVPTSEFVQKLIAARLATDVMGVPTILIARTDASNATLISSDIDPRDRPFLAGARTVEGFFRTRGGLDAAITRALACAPYTDLLWFETSKPSLEEAGRFAEAIHAEFPGKLFYYNCSSSFNWKKLLDESTISRFQPELATMGYKFQNCSRLGLASMHLSLFKIGQGYRRTGMTAYAGLQGEQIAAVSEGYTDWKHHRAVGAGYFDEVARTVIGETLSTAALAGSTEESQF